jgi:TetR/AcrR family transcriptional regulator, transcriptional repressor for nem operon
MRYDSEHKQQTREKVLKVAAKAIRAEGPRGVGVATIMSKAGLTHGGFYAHFESKDDLIAAAIETMFADARTRLQRELGDKSPAEGLAGYIDFYLSTKHRDAVAHGCPLPALAPELPRLERRARQTFSAGVAHMTTRIANQLASIGHKDAPELANSVVAELVGALSLARAEPDEKHSDHLLAVSRQQLKSRIGLKS